MRTRVILSSLALFLGAQKTDAYEVGTHARITHEAYNQSSLSSLGPIITSTKLGQVGLLDLSGIIGSEFIEFSGQTTRIRRQHYYEQEVMGAAIFDTFLRRREPNSAGAQVEPSYPRRPIGWLVTGAIREDDGAGRIFFPGDYIGSDGAIANEVLQNDNPIGGHVNRFCNHFYDPMQGSSSLNSAKLTGITCPQTFALAESWGIAAPAWALALQTGTSFFDAVANLQTRANHLAISDAKESMWRAATGYEGTMQAKVASSGAERMRYWATVFRSLGGVAHLLQDMSQPQHTRNEAHPAGLSQSYEKYVEYRSSNTFKSVTFGASGEFRATKEELANPWPPSLWNSYPTIPKFTKYEHYWHKSNGMGMAPYTNAGFLTAGKNIGNTSYAAPPQSANDARYTTVSTQELIDGEYFPVERLHIDVPDMLQPTPDRIAMTRRSTLDWLATNTPESQDAVVQVRYGPDSMVYDAQAGLLLPRAVAYSAGLIDHFFRGQLRIDAPENGVFAYSDTSKDEANDPRYSTVGFKRIKFKVTNTTEAITPPGGSAVDQNIANAKLVAAVKYVANRCATAGNDLTGEWGAPGRDYSSCREGVMNGQILTANILGAEKLAVSRTCKINGVSALSNVAIAAQQQIEVECDFVEEPIPYSGTDMKLVVAIRGDLGEEKDAVIVQVENISEPGWITYQNHTDHVVIDDKVYRWNAMPSKYNHLNTAGCMSSTANTVYTVGSGINAASVQGCALFPVWGMIYPNAYTNTAPMARVKLAPTEYAQVAYLAPPKYRDFAHMPRMSHTCGLKAHGNAGAIGEVTAPYYPYVPAAWTEAQKDALMYANAKKMFVYETLHYPMRNEIDYQVLDPATWSIQYAQEPVVVFRGRGQQTGDDPITSADYIRPAGCLASLYYEPTPAERPNYANKPGFNGFVYLHQWQTKAMFDALPNTKIGVQKAVTFCADEDCTQ